MSKCVMALDVTTFDSRAREMGFKHFPLREAKAYLEEEFDCDAIEIFIPLEKRAAREDIGETREKADAKFASKCFAMEMSGATVIEFSSRNKIHRNDDVHCFALYVLDYCLRVKPDFLILFAQEAGYSHLMKILRQNGIPTILVAFSRNLSNELKKIKYDFEEAEDMLLTIGNSEDFKEMYPDVVITKLPTATYTDYQTNDEE